MHELRGQLPPEVIAVFDTYEARQEYEAPEYQGVLLPRAPEVHPRRRGRPRVVEPGARPEEDFARTAIGAIAARWSGGSAENDVKRRRSVSEPG